MDAAELAKINDINANLDRAEVPIPGVVMEEEVPEPFNVRTVILQGLIPLFIVIALVLLAYAGLRKLGKRNPLLSGGEHMTCIGRLYLDRTSRIHLVRVGGRVLVVGTTGNAVTLLGDMDANAFSGDGHAPAQPVEQPTARQSDSFYDELQANLARINRQQQPPEDADIEQIRTEIVRLKRVLEDEPGEHAE
jgi:flagellar biosynthetic protein FliO